MPGPVIAAILLALVSLPAAADVHHIDIHDYRLRISCEGSGTPTVIMDSGLGGSSLEWVFVSERLRDLTRVCVYDRAGYGGSDMGPLPRTSSTIANELYLLLQDSTVSPPFVLVGHSFGGYNMQLFARRYPYLCAGLVLIDSSHPDQVQRFLAPPLKMLTAPSSRFGIVRFSDPPPPNTHLPAPIKRMVMKQAKLWKTRRTLASELLNFRDSAMQIKHAAPLVDMPLVVITRGRIDGELTPRRLQIERVWLELQSELAALSTVSAHLVARESGHQVHIEQPDLVAFAIAMLVDRHRLRSGRSGAGADADGHDRFPLDGASWLEDTLSLYPATVVAHSRDGVRAVR